MRQASKRMVILLSISLGLALSSRECLSIDDPDAPDLVAGFEARSKPFETAIHGRSRDGWEISRAYADYEKFLDREINLAYAALAKQTSGAVRRNLADSQRRWLEYRDAEFGFIASNWTPENFGSSYVISRSTYRTEVTKSRIVTLLNYLRNYPDPKR